jgi:DNA mismatch repair protein MutS2
MVNGAVEFDLDRMRPLYKLHIGFPGRSFAIDMACRLGVPPSIVQRARELRGDTSAGVAVLLDRLHAIESARAQDAAATARERADAVSAKEQAEMLTRELAERLAVLRARAERLVADISAEGRKRVEAAVADIRRGGSPREAREALEAIGALSERELADVSAGVPVLQAARPPATVTIGQTVRVRHLGQVGTVLTPANAQGLVEVQLPVGKVRVPVAELVVTRAPVPSRAGQLVTWTAGVGDALAPELNVIGSTVEEAIATVGRYLEDAVLGGLGSVRIVHGKGTGRLRRGLAEFLKTHPLVAGFHLAAFNEGGAGATVVDLGPQAAAGEPPA